MKKKETNQNKCCWTCCCHGNNWLYFPWNVLDNQEQARRVWPEFPIYIYVFNLSTYNPYLAWFKGLLIIYYLDTVALNSKQIRVRTHDIPWVLQLLNPSFEDLDLKFGENSSIHWRSGYFVTMMSWQNRSISRCHNAVSRKWDNKAYFLGGSIFKLLFSFYILCYLKFCARFFYDRFHMFKDSRDTILETLGEYPSLFIYNRNAKFAKSFTWNKFCATSTNLNDHSRPKKATEWEIMLVSQVAESDTDVPNSEIYF